MFDELICDLIFGSDQEYKIDISEYIEDIYRYEKFVDQIKIILKKSKVSIVSERVDVSMNTAVWTLKVKR